MKFSEQELELLSMFIGKYWNEFFTQAEEISSIYALHRLAEKLGLDQKTN